MRRLLNFVREHRQLFRVIAVCLFLATIILGVLWICDPNGNYEPVISVIGALAALIGVPTLTEMFVPQSELLHQIWDRLEPDLQDVLTLAYNQACRNGHTIIRTRYFFAAIVRLEPAPIPELLNRIPPKALPEPIAEDVVAAQSILSAHPILSNCVDDSLKHLSQKATPQNKLSSADVFVDIAKYGTGRSVRRLRTYGVTPEKVTDIVEQLGWRVVER